MTAQVFALLVVLPCAAFILMMVRRGALRIKYVMLWIPVVVGLLVLAIVPGLLDRAAALAGIAYPPTMLFVLALGFLLMVCVHFSWELSRLEERVRLLAEHVALREARTGQPDGAHARRLESAPARADVS